MSKETVLAEYSQQFSAIIEDMTINVGEKDAKIKELDVITIQKIDKEEANERKQRTA